MERYCNRQIQLLIFGFCVVGGADPTKKIWIAHHSPAFIETNENSWRSDRLIIAVDKKWTSLVQILSRSVRLLRSTVDARYWYRIVKTISITFSPITNIPSSGISCLLQQAFTTAVLHTIHSISNGRRRRPASAGTRGLSGAAHNH